MSTFITLKRLLIAVCLVPVLALTSYGQSIVNNGDFESWTAGVPDGWTTIESGIVVTEATSPVYGGSKSASVDVITGTQGDTDFRQTVNVIGGTDYDVSVWVYHTEGFVKARLYVGTYLDYSDNTIVGSWQEITYTYSAASDGSVEIGLRFYDQSGFDGAEIVYVDDFTMTPTGGGGPTTDQIFFEPFDSDLGQTSGYNAVGAQFWDFGNFGLPAGCSVMNGYDGGAQDNEDWLITNSIDCSNFTNVTLRFDHARNYNDNSGLSVLVSTDYDGSSDPNGFTWTDLTSSFAFPASGSWTFNDAGTVDINALVGPSTFIAFKYISTTAGAATWEIDNITVAGDFNVSAFVAGSFNSWNGSDPDYELELNANGLLELTKSMAAATHEYKIVESGNWYPGNNQQIVLTATENVTWKYNFSDHLVTHTLPVVAGNFVSEIGGNDWDPTDLHGEMVDPEGDDIYTLEVTIPAGNYEAKVTLNNNWDQSTGGNVPFVTDGVTPTIFTYDFSTNTTTISGPAPPAALVTFIVDDAAGQNYDGFALKGSWDANGQYDPSWGNGMEHSMFYDDGTNGDVTAGDHIWTCQQDLVVDGGSNNWEWGVNDSEGNWIAGNWIFTVPTDVPQTLSWTVPTTPALIINEIMYNSIGTDEEWVELYNNTDQVISLENWKIIDDNGTHTPIVFPAGNSIDPYTYFTVEVATGGAFPFTPNYDGSWAGLALGNSGDAVRLYNADGILIDIVSYEDSSPWPSAADGDGPSLSLFQTDLDNALAENWKASNQDGGSPGEINFPINILTPNGGEMIDLGSNFEITWTVNGWDGNINIELIREGYDPMLLVSNMPVSDQTFSWFVFDNLDVASDYRIMISPTDGGNPFDVSDDYFALVQQFEAVPIVITEIMYNPPESGTDSLEFIELYNNGADAVDMNGFHFSKGVEFEFINITMQPYEYLLVSFNAAAMQSTFGVTALQWTGGALSNGGEDLELQDAGNNIIDFVSYDDALPWDTLADGYGPSLTLCNPNVDNNVAENWTHSINLAAINAVGDSIWATPGEGCANTLIAGFEGMPTDISLGGSVMFTDLSFGPVTQWTWTFEGGTPATFDGQTPPEIFYNEEGTWDVTLLISDGVNTDEITMMDYITVVDLPAPINLQATVGPNDDVNLTWLAPGTVGGFEDDFESYEDFAIDFSPWVNLDVDGSTTYGMTDIEWPNAYVEQSFIIFNPSQTTPAVDDIIPHSGDKLAACFAATAPPNNDWLITPEVLIQSGYNVSFFAKSYTDQYGLERFKVGVSTTGLNPDDFTIISEGAYVEAPVEDWTEFTYDLSAYAGQMVYVGIQCVSNDAFILLVDDISISATKSAIVYNPSQPIIGKGTKDVSVTAQPTVMPSSTIHTSRGINAELLGYNVYRDALKINADLVTLTEYYDEMPAIGTHEYYVTAVYDAGESSMSNVVTILITDINENSVNAVTVYPNPSNGIFTIEMPNMNTAKVMVMDINGKVVFDNTVIFNDQIKLQNVEQGMYFIRIADPTSGNIVVKKLLVN
jgi:PKD repeat protein